jgi:hypothetical protein
MLAATGPADGAVRRIRIASAGFTALSAGPASGAATRTFAVTSFDVVPGLLTRRPRLWLYLRLCARVTIPAAARGEVVLSAETNGFTAAQVLLQPRGDSMVVDSLGWISGHRRFAVPGRTAHVLLSNYLQERGARSGANRFAVHLSPALPGSNVRLARCTGIGATRARPDELRLVAPRAVSATTGIVSIPVSLYRRGGWPDRGGMLSVTGAGAGLRLLSPATIAFDRIGTGVRRAVRLRATRPGRYLMSIAVPDLYNQAHRYVVVEVRPGSHQGDETLRAALLAGGIAGVAATAVALAGRLRSRTRR